MGGSSTIRGAAAASLILVGFPAARCFSARDLDCCAPAADEDPPAQGPGATAPRPQLIQAVCGCSTVVGASAGPLCPHGARATPSGGSVGGVFVVDSPVVLFVPEPYAADGGAPSTWFPQGGGSSRPAALNPLCGTFPQHCRPSLPVHHPLLHAAARPPPQRLLPPPQPRQLPLAPRLRPRLPLSAPQQWPPPPPATAVAVPARPTPARPGPGSQWEIPAPPPPPWGAAPQRRSSGWPLPAAAGAGVPRPKRAQRLAKAQRDEREKWTQLMELLESPARDGRPERAVQKFIRDLPSWTPGPQPLLSRLGPRGQGPQLRLLDCLPPAPPSAQHDVRRGLFRLLAPALYRGGPPAENTRLSSAANAPAAFAEAVRLACRDLPLADGYWAPPWAGAGGAGGPGKRARRALCAACRVRHETAAAPRNPSPAPCVATAAIFGREFFLAVLAELRALLDARYAEATPVPGAEPQPAPGPEAQPPPEAGAASLPGEAASLPTNATSLPAAGAQPLRPPALHPLQSAEADSLPSATAPAELPPADTVFPTALSPLESPPPPLPPRARSTFPLPGSKPADQPPSVAAQTSAHCPPESKANLLALPTATGADRCVSKEFAEGTPNFSLQPGATATGRGRAQVTAVRTTRLGDVLRALTAGFRVMLICRQYHKETAEVGTTLRCFATAKSFVPPAGETLSALIAVRPPKSRVPLADILGVEPVHVWGPRDEEEAGTPLVSAAGGG